MQCSKGSLASSLLLLASDGTMDLIYTLSSILFKFLSHIGSFRRSSLHWVSCDPKCNVRELFQQNYKSNLILIHVTLMCSLRDPGRLQLRVAFRSFADVILCQLDNHLFKPGRQAGIFVKRVHFVIVKCHLQSTSRPHTVIAACLPPSL